MWMWPVKGSSNVRAVGYDRRKKELGIRFNSSPQKYIYSDVPISIYKDLVQAPSRGKFVHQHIKGYYPYRRKDYAGEEFAWEEEMPSKSQKQQRYFGWLYSKKKSGDTSGMSPKDIKTMESMSKEQIRDFAATKRKNLPVVLKKESAYTGLYQHTGERKMSMPIIIKQAAAKRWPEEFDKLNPESMRPDFDPGTDKTYKGKGTLALVDNATGKSVKNRVLSHSTPRAEGGGRANMLITYNKPWYRRKPSHEDILRGDKYKMMVSDVVTPLNGNRLLENMAEYGKKVKATGKKGTREDFAKIMRSSENRSVPTVIYSRYAARPLLFGRKRFDEMAAKPRVTGYFATDGTMDQMSTMAGRAHILEKDYKKLYEARNPAQRGYVARKQVQNDQQPTE